MGACELKRAPLVPDHRGGIPGADDAVAGLSGSSGASCGCDAGGSSIGGTPSCGAEGSGIGGTASGSASARSRARSRLPCCCSVG